MTLIANSFLKLIPVTLSSSEATAGLATRTMNARIEDSSTIAVYYNGQEIPGGVSPVTPESKFYYSVVITLNPATVSLTGTLPVDTSTAAFTIQTNPAYQGPGYTSGVSTTTFSILDSLMISYYYVIYSE